MLLYLVILISAVSERLVKESVELSKREEGVREVVGECHCVKSQGDSTKGSSDSVRVVAILVRCDVSWWVRRLLSRSFILRPPTRVLSKAPDTIDTQESEQVLVSSSAPHKHRSRLRCYDDLSRTCSNVYSYAREYRSCTTDLIEYNLMSRCATEGHDS